jgi:hypothetical protein
MPAASGVEFRKNSLLKCLDLRRAFVCQIRPNSPGAFALLKPDNGSGPTIRRAVEMQNQVLACALCICEVIKIYDAAIRRADEIHGNTHYQVWKGYTRTPQINFKVSATDLHR